MGQNPSSKLPEGVPRPRAATCAWFCCEVRASTPRDGNVDVDLYKDEKYGGDIVCETYRSDTQVVPPTGNENEIEPLDNQIGEKTGENTRCEERRDSIASRVSSDFPVDVDDPLHRHIQGACGSTYSGQVHPVTAVYDGSGSLTMEDYVLQGTFRQGNLSGFGQIRWNDGRKYSGEFSEGKFDGEGLMEWPHHRGKMSYRGQYRDDMKNGHGRFEWPSGRYYEGQWVDGKRSGLGVEVTPYGTRSKGKFENNIMVESLDINPS